MLLRVILFSSFFCLSFLALAGSLFAQDVGGTPPGLAAVASDSCAKRIVSALSRASTSQLEYDQEEGVIMFYEYDSIAHDFTSKGWIFAKGTPNEELQEFMNRISFRNAKRIRAWEDCVVQDKSAVFVVPLYFPHPLGSGGTGRNIFQDNAEYKQMIMRFYDVPGFVLLPTVTMSW
ncbi:hypothetical protein FUA23_09235 [Neolewinella aurantiaca]|uniref:Uncharacterized protein n=1 Tax=Neolewinella aurantiaca TaxID=2602767 RepID=A0A5C7FXC6_9BACT|nr:hypothetical protein [Neolewinella aurantiaca]TXF89626.1 hypothetical protein FUA23_09235 [Neolewinella aurantiaca]